jgi:hypothetical protein
MKQKGNVIVIVLVSVILLAIIGFLVYQNMQLKKQAVIPSTTPTTTTTTSAPSVTPTPTPSLKPGWKLYQNSQYKFEFSHPASYKVLTSSEDLYGWPKAILLLYDGGQSYDLAIEIWNTEAEYKANYNDTTVLTVFKTKDGKFITLLNTNKDPEIAEIISTFKFTE